MADKTPSSKTFSLFEDIVILAFAILGLGGGVALWLAKSPPIIISVFLGIGVAALAYRFLGGISSGSSFGDGALKVGGSLGALLAAASFINSPLVQQTTMNYTIRGTLENLEAEETMTSREANLFLRRVYDQVGFDYEWLLVTPTRLADGAKISFLFDRGREDGRSATRHELTVRSSLYDQADQKLRIQYTRASDKLFQLNAGGNVELTPIEDDRRSELREARPPARSLLSLFMPTVFAQWSAASLDVLRKRLESPDPIIRQDARNELASRGKSALPVIRTILADPASSYRARLGAIYALNGMRGISADDVNGAPFKAILQAVKDPDKLLADEAFRFFTKYIVSGSAHPAGGKPVVDVKATSASEGSFRFAFSATPKAGAVSLALDEITCLEDSSGGTTRWLFVVAAGSSSFAVAEQRYGDAQGQNRYPTAAANRTRYSLTAPAGVPVRIVGYKPKHIE